MNSHTPELTSPNLPAAPSGVVCSEFVRQYWLYVWPESKQIPGRPTEYSRPPVILKSANLHEALELSRAHTAGALKWEMYEGSGWSGKSPVATGRLPNVKLCEGSGQ